MIAHSRRLISASIAFLCFCNLRYFGWAMSRGKLEWKPPPVPLGLTRCELHVDCPIDDKENSSNNKTLYFYNPGLYPRNVCGTKLEPHQLEAIEGCFDTDGGGQSTTIWNPTRVEFRGAKTQINGKSKPLLDDDMSSSVDCDVPCELVKPSHASKSPVQVVEVSNATFLYSMEGSQYFDEIRIRDHAWKHDMYYATTSWKSTIPLLYYSEINYPNLQATPNQTFDRLIPGAAFLARNCQSHNGFREQFVKDLAATDFRVDRLGDCLHDTDSKIGLDASKVEIVAPYMFSLAVENQREDDYITEKLWESYSAGTIPIYYGAPNIRDRVPDESSLIFVDDFDSVQDLANHLQAITRNETLWKSYHVWRKLPLPFDFSYDHDFSNVHSHCRLCRWGHARSHGHVWLPDPQRYIFVNRTVCLDNEGHLTYPIMEATFKCEQFLNETNSILSVNNGIQRTIIDHGDYLDLYLFSKRKRTYVVKAFVKSYWQQRSPGVWYTQDDMIRMTVMSDASSMYSLFVLSSKYGLRVSVYGHVRLRIVLEGYDRLHQGAEKVETYFGKLLRDDFERPVQSYY